MNVRYLIIVLTLGVLIGCNNVEEMQLVKQDSENAPKIGVYDSRAIAVAYCDSPYHKKEFKKLKDAFDEAKKNNDADLIASCEEAIKESQNQMHRQGFSTAPVEDILALIPDKIQTIQKELNVTAIVSKWNKGELAKFKNASQIDVTEELIHAFQPNERQLKYAIEIQDRKPIALDKIDELIQKERNH